MIYEKDLMFFNKYIILLGITQIISLSSSTKRCNTKFYYWLRLGMNYCAKNQLQFTKQKLVYKKIKF